MNPAYAQYPSLADRVVLVTGGASGIGASMVEHFCAQGARVAFLDIDQEAGKALAATLAGRAPRDPLFIACDLCDIEALQAGIARARAHFGPIGVLVNNAANDYRHGMGRFRQRAGTPAWPSICGTSFSRHRRLLRTCGGSMAGPSSTSARSAG